MEAIPHATRVGVLWDPATPSHALALKALEATGKKLEVKLQMVPASTVEEFDPAFTTMTTEHVDCFLVVPSVFAYSNRNSLANLALKYRLGGVFQQKESVEAGGLMSYGADTLDLYRRAASYVDRILKGEKPAEFTGRATDKIRVGDQSQDCEGAWHQRSADAARHCRRGDRIARRFPPPWSVEEQEACSWCAIRVLTGQFRCPLLGVKRTSPRPHGMSAFDPKRTFAAPVCCDATKPHRTRSTMW